MKERSDETLDLYNEMLTYIKQGAAFHPGSLGCEVVNMRLDTIPESVSCYRTPLGTSYHRFISETEIDVIFRLTMPGFNRGFLCHPLGSKHVSHRDRQDCAQSLLPDFIYWLSELRHENRILKDEVRSLTEDNKYLEQENARLETELAYISAEGYSDSHEIY